MTMVNYEGFFPYIQPQVPGCPDPSIIVAVRNACIDFCEQTLFLQSVIDSQILVTNQANYDFGLSTGEELAHIIALYVNGIKCTKKAPAELDDLYRYLDWTTFTGQPIYYTQMLPDEVILVPYPDNVKTYTLTGRIARRPTEASTTFDSLLLERYNEEIAQGALARLHMQPDQSYTSPNAALVAKRIFDAAIGNAKSYVRGGMSPSTHMRVRFNRMW